jgi:DNA-binding NarL/FixJ family response regulator
VNKILIRSRHALLVAGFRSLVAEPAGLVVFHCADDDDLFPLFESSQPDVALVDVNSGMPPESLNELKSLATTTPLILWVDRASPEFVRQTIALGVRGILRKDAPVGLYSQCFDRVASDKLWLEDEMTEKLLAARAVRLSPRERELVSLLTQGLRNKEIAWRMKITEGTTKVYLSRIFEKTGASDRFELALFALQNLDTIPITTLSRSQPAA